MTLDAGQPVPAEDFFGREDELATLRRSLDEACAGHARAVLITGEPGIGKTRLAERFADQAELTGGTVVWARCWEGAGAPPFWPWTQLLRDCVRRFPSLVPPSGEFARLAQLVPELGRTRSGAPEPQLNRQHARFRLFDAVLSFLAQAASNATPLLLVVEDVHEADEPSLALLDFVAVELRAAPLLILATCREPSSVGSDSSLADHAARLRLRGLSRSQVAELVSHRLGQVNEAVAGALHDATDGNPFFVEAVVRTLDAGSDPVQLAVPTEVRSAIHARLGLLPAAVRETLSWAAVMGRSFDSDPLPYLLHRPADEVERDMATAAGGGIVEACPDGTFRFRQPLVYDAFYDTLSPPRRAAMHQRVAEVLEGLQGDRRLPALAYHYLQAVPRLGPEKALAYAEAAGRDAAARHAYEDAAAHLSRALELVPSADTRRRGRLLLQLADAEQGAGRLADARRSLQRAVQVARRLDDARLLGRVALRLGGGRIEHGIPDRSLIALLEEALEGLGDEDPALRARLLGRLAVALHFTDAMQQRDAISGEAVAIARDLDDPALLAACLNARHFATWHPATLGERLRLSAEAIDRAQCADDVELELEGRIWAIVDMLERGDRDAAEAHLLRYQEAARRLGVPVYRWYLQRFEALLALLDARFDAVESAALQARATGRAAGIPSAEQFAAVQLFCLRHAQGRLAEMSGVVERFAQTLPALPVWGCALALLLAETGRRDEALAVVEEFAVKSFELPEDGNLLAGLALLTETCGVLGASQHAPALRERLRPYARAHVIVASAVTCFGAVAHHLATLDVLCGDLDAAVGRLGDALAGHLEMGARWWAARSVQLQGEILRCRGRRGDPARGRELLQEAQVMFRSLGVPAASVALPNADSLTA